jgi:hypothetical protein
MIRTIVYCLRACLSTTSSTATGAAYTMVRRIINTQEPQQLWYIQSGEGGALTTVITWGPQTLMVHTKVAPTIIIAQGYTYHNLMTIDYRTLSGNILY